MVSIVAKAFHFLKGSFYLGFLNFESQTLSYDLFKDREFEI